jgi:hypothetical protein
MTTRGCRQPIRAGRRRQAAIPSPYSASDPIGGNHAEAKVAQRPLGNIAAGRLAGHRARAPAAAGHAAGGGRLRHCRRPPSAPGRDAQDRFVVAAGLCRRRPRPGGRQRSGAAGGHHWVAGCRLLDHELTGVTGLWTRCPIDTLEFMSCRCLPFATGHHRGAEWSRSMLPAALTGSWSRTWVRVCRATSGVAPVPAIMTWTCLASCSISRA